LEYPILTTFGSGRGIFSDLPQLIFNPDGHFLAGNGQKAAPDAKKSLKMDKTITKR
jgi:hypothetical protein